MSQHEEGNKGKAVSKEQCTLIFMIIYLPCEVSPSHFASLASEKPCAKGESTTGERRWFENRAQSSLRGTSLPLQGPGTQREGWGD